MSYRYVQASAHAAPHDEELWHGLVNAPSKDEAQIFVAQVISDDVRYYNEHVFELVETQEDLCSELDEDGDLSIPSRSVVVLKSIMHRYIQEGRQINRNKRCRIPGEIFVPEIVDSIAIAKNKDAVNCSRRQMRELILFCLQEGQRQMAVRAPEKSESEKA